ncbi:hypothetical protein V6N13_118947 [Hibiscus sabdariffa]|uniref:Uncharacterized protein n=1 Tax=Hibiscus sabdariffa TaxID=183260 RepID=A0ABR2DZU2_9ROSI
MSRIRILKKDVRYRGRKREKSENLFYRCSQRNFEEHFCWFLLILNICFSSVEVLRIGCTLTTAKLLSGEFSTKLICKEADQLLTYQNLSSNESRKKRLPMSLLC